MLFKFKSPYHLARFILFSRSNLEVGILIQNKVNICKSIFMWNTGRIVHSYTTCTWICFASNVLWLQYSGRIPHVQWFIWRYSRASIFFSGLGLVPVFSFFLLFPLPALFNPNPLHQRAFRCVRCSTWAVANSVGFFFYWNGTYKHKLKITINTAPDT